LFWEEFGANKGDFSPEGLLAKFRKKKKTPGASGEASGGGGIKIQFCTQDKTETDWAAKSRFLVVEKALYLSCPYFLTMRYFSGRGGISPVRM